LQRMLDPALPYGIHSYWKSNFVQTLSDGAIDTFVSHARSRTSSRTICIFEHSHGKVHRVPPEATAMSLRKHRLAMHLLAVWEGGEPEAHIRWTRQFWSAMQPYSAGSVYVNSLAVDDSDRIPEAYGLNYQRLREIKTKYDPSNVFRVNHNIRPN
jgi:hypothetical protein